jgi:imidazolonepropionase-like amidohydrolase
MKSAVCVCILLLSTLSLASVAGSDVKVVDDGLLIKDVTVISPERQAPLPHAVVVIRDGRISQIATDFAAGPRTKQVDGRGRFLIPGLIDSHVHVGNMGPLGDDAISAHPDLLQAYRSQLPRSYLAFGFTTLVDLDLRQETLSWFNAAPVHPNICSCGRGVRIVGGYMALNPPKDAAAANTVNVVYESARAKDWPANLDPHDYTPARAVDRAAAASAICVKTFIEPGFGGAAHWPVPLPETLKALREEATRRGLVFVIHANAVKSWQAALDAHADVIAHGLWHWPGDRLGTIPPDEASDVIRAVARTGISVQPTLQAVYGDLSIFDKSLLNDSRFGEALPRAIVSYLKSDEGQKWQRAMADEYRQAITQLLGSSSVDSLKAMSTAPARAAATLRMMLADNVKLLFGTDTPSNEGIGNPPGLNGRLEITRWSEVGVPLSRILRAATIDNATAFGLSGDRGTIEVGKRADLLLLRADPLKTVAAYDAIDTIFVNGNPITRSALLPTK